MRIIRSYILRETVLPFLISLSVLTCIFLLGNLIRLTDLVINKGVSVSAIGQVFIYCIPFLLGYTLPIACLTAIMLTFSRLSADNEILALRASGVHLRRLLWPLLVLGLILSFFSIVLNDRLIPYAHHEQRKILKSVGAKNPTALLEAGSFIHDFKGQILFVYKIEGNRLFNVRIYQPQENRPTRTIVAKEGEFTPVPGKDQIKLKLINGTADEPNLDDPENFYKLKFRNYFMTLDMSDNGNKEIDKKPKSMSLKELENKIDELHKLFVDTTPLVTEYYRKITWSFSALIFIMLGFPIAVVTHRREKTANIALAIFCAAAYYLFSLSCEALSIQNIAPPMMVMWAPNLMAGLLALYLNYRICRI